MGSAKIQLVGCWLHRGSLTNSLTDEGYVKENPQEKIYTEDIHVLELAPGEQKKTKGTMKIPQDLTPTQVECDVLKLCYRLKAVLDDMSGFRSIGMSADVEVDVIIGSNSKSKECNYCDD